MKEGEEEGKGKEGRNVEGKEAPEEKQREGNSGDNYRVTSGFPSLQTRPHCLPFATTSSYGSDVH